VWIKNVDEPKELGEDAQRKSLTHHDPNSGLIKVLKERNTIAALEWNNKVGSSSSKKKTQHSGGEDLLRGFACVCCTRASKG